MFDPTNPEAFLKEAEVFFFEAMREGYAKPSAEKTRIIGMPCSKLLPAYVRGPWMLQDFYFASRTFADSAGMTMIWYDAQPVWQMHYEGWYVAEAIPFLKRCLAGSYERNKFNGGRGKHFLMERSEGVQLHYHNWMDYPPSRFEYFSGREWIEKYENDGEERLGEHRYQGRSLITNRRPY